MTTLLQDHVVAHRLSVTCRQLNRMVRAGEIPHIVLPNGSVRFTESDLEALVTTRRRSADPLPQVVGGGGPNL